MRQLLAEMAEAEMAAISTRELSAAA